VKVGDLVKIRYSQGQGNMGIIATEPRWGVNVMAPDGTTGKKVCEVYFMATQQVATRACADLEVINEGR
jgi:GTPase involved in cell partitioning and DNA repair